MPRLDAGSLRKGHQRSTPYLQFLLVNDALQVIQLEPGHFSSETDTTAAIQDHVVRQDAASQEVDAMD